ncbi:MAG: zipA [Gammaproteobacteria bacterium]|jgi:cell division protein ZipA|nr:zipA [Gammaproteobacteria bacterium]
MTSYILLALLVTIVALGVIRATRQPKINRRKKLPGQGSLLNGSEVDEGLFISDNTSDHEVIDVLYETSTPVKSYQAQANIVEEPRADYTVKASSPKESPRRERKNEVITITLRAAEHKPYKGYELLQALLTSGLRYNRTGVFHRYQKLINRDEVLFSLISAVAPGTFELPKMGVFSSPALTLFMQTGDHQDPLQIYNMMLSTAKELVDTLGGYLLDEHKVPLTAEKVEAWQAHLEEA